MGAYGGRDRCPSPLAPGSDEPHHGADDNASGTAALLEAARVLAGHQIRDVHDPVYVLRPDVGEATVR